MSQSQESLEQMRSFFPSLSSGTLFGDGILIAWIFFIVLMFVILPVLYLSFSADRKIGADFQARVGPHRAGVVGFVQFCADLIKLTKKERAPDFKNTTGFWLVFRAAILGMLIVSVPLGRGFFIVDSDLAVVAPVWIMTLALFSRIIFGFEKNKIQNWFGAARELVQFISALFPVLICLAAAGIAIGGLSWEGFISKQGFFPNQWLIFSNPFLVLSFLVFYVSGLGLMGVGFLDSASTETDLLGGVMYGESGVRVVLFYVTQFYSFWVWSVVTAILFLGGWKLPGNVVEFLSDQGWSAIENSIEILVVLLKAALLMFFVGWITRVTPKMRIDHLTRLFWRRLSPAAVFSLVGVSVVELVLKWMRP